MNLVSPFGTYFTFTYSRNLLFISDLHTVYIGSANLTGAGLGMKSKNHRNFEAGILTDEPEIVSQVMADFDKVWNGSKCPKCKRKQYCPIPISEMY